MKAFFFSLRFRLLMLVLPGVLPALGLLAQSVYQTAECTLAANDTLVLYTDGVFEVTGSNDEEFGSDRLIAAIEARMESRTEKIFEEVLAEIRRFSASGFEHDLCLVGVDIRGA